MFAARRTFLWRPESLDRVKNDAALAPVVAATVARARRALTIEPITVVAKRRSPASGDIHDYASLAPYWWPDPTRPGGLPYRRDDGRVNPESVSDSFDATAMSGMSEAVTTLALAYFYTDDRRFATQAAAMLRAWFLTPATRMNPNLIHAQSIPGIASGRPEGIIDAMRLMTVVEAIGLIGPSGAVSNGEQDAIERWFGDLSRWMATSDAGREQAARRNNHGIAHDLMVTQFALFARDTTTARRIVVAFPAKRLAVQIDRDGSLPAELGRTRSWHYVNETLTSALQLATLGECVGVDLWQAQTPDGRGLRLAVDWVARYVGREQDWPHTELGFAKGSMTKATQRDALEMLRLAAWGWHDAALEAKAARYALNIPEAPELRWLAPLSPTIAK